jgi:hypothetical protein
MSITGWQVCKSCNGMKCKLCNGMGYVGEKPAKYHNKKTEVNGIEFDSKAEADYYVYAMQLQAAGHITRLDLQPRFELMRAFTDNELRRHRAIVYVADFYIEYKDGRRLVIDVKGVQTAEFKLKRKLYAYRATIEMWPELAVIAFDAKFGWIDSDELKKMEALGNGKPKRTAKKETKQATAGRGKGRKSRDIRARV